MSRTCFWVARHIVAIFFLTMGFTTTALQPALAQGGYFNHETKRWVRVDTDAFNKNVARHRAAFVSRERAARQAQIRRGRTSARTHGNGMFNGLFGTADNDRRYDPLAKRQHHGVQPTPTAQIRRAANAQTRARHVRPKRKKRVRTASSRAPRARNKPFELAPKYEKQTVAYDTGHAPGSVIIDTQSRYLYYVLEHGEAIRYGVGVGRQGFSWQGTAHVGRKQVNPAWHPPKAMRARQPELPKMVKGGDPENPLGVRAMYLYKGDKDTLYRIHGTTAPWSIGRAVSSGCIRMLNAHVVDLFDRVEMGAKVVVF